MSSDHIFVFGSNLSGIHGAGAAAYAAKNYGAKFGVGRGITGNSYAIPTKNESIRTLPIHKIQNYVEEFLVYATKHPKTKFHLTQIGCGLAGYTARDIAPMFEFAPINVLLVDDFGSVVGYACDWLHQYDN